LVPFCRSSPAQPLYQPQSPGMAANAYCRRKDSRAAFPGPNPQQPTSLQHPSNPAVASHASCPAFALDRALETIEAIAPLAKRIDARPSPISDAARSDTSGAWPTQAILRRSAGRSRPISRRYRPGTQCEQFHDLRPLDQMFGEQIRRLAAAHQRARCDPSWAYFRVCQPIEQLGESLLAVGRQRPQIVVRITVFIVLFAQACRMM